MPVSKDNIRINVDLDKDVLLSLDQLKDELNLTRSNIINNLIRMSLHDLNIMGHTGIIAISVPIKNAIEKISNVKFESPQLSKSENTGTVVVTIDKETKAILDAYAEDFEIPIKKLTRNLIYSTLDDYKFLKKTRLLKIALRFKNTLKMEDSVDEELEKRIDN